MLPLGHARNRVEPIRLTSDLSNKHLECHALGFSSAGLLAQHARLVYALLRCTVLVLHVNRCLYMPARASHKKKRQKY